MDIHHPKVEPASKGIADNDCTVMYDPEAKPSLKMVMVRRGDKYQSVNRAYRYNHMVGKQYGEALYEPSDPAHAIYALEPKSTLITETLERRTQILYAMDNAAILLKLALVPGSVVVEAGTGSGSLSCALAECIGQQGKLYTFEFNKERNEANGQFFSKLGLKNITNTHRNVDQGFTIEGHPYAADAMFLDLPTPWTCLEAALHVLKQSKFREGQCLQKRHYLIYMPIILQWLNIDAHICCFSPCIEQVQRTCQQMRRMRFKCIETVECLVREIEQKQVELRGTAVTTKRTLEQPAFNSRGHTGYLTFAVIQKSVKP